MIKLTIVIIFLTHWFEIWVGGFRDGLEVAVGIEVGMLLQIAKGRLQKPHFQPCRGVCKFANQLM
jgi:hypothetical protein